MSASRETLVQRVVMFSGGDGSWATAKRVANRHGTDGLILLFADTREEDEDTYRFLEEAAANVGGQLVKTAEGRSVWEVFRDKRFLGNTRVDLCSRILKREWLRTWLDEHCDPAHAVVYLGIDAEEAHRAERAAPRWEPYTVEFPLLRPPMTKAMVRRWRQNAGLREQRLYALGFPHANCGGFCVKAGQAQFELLLRTMPERYARHEAEEEALRTDLGKDVAILRDRTGGLTRPLTMRSFRERIEAQGSFDRAEWGGCGCFAPLVEEVEHAA